MEPGLAAGCGGTDSKTDRRDWTSVLRGAVVFGFVATLVACSTPESVALRPGISVAEPAKPEERQRLELVANCTAHRTEAHGSASIAEQQASMTRELLAYQGLVEEALAMRARAISLANELRDKVHRGEALSGMDLMRVNQGAAAMLDQRSALFKVSLSHECWLDDPVPTDQAAMEIQAKGVAMSLSAALVLYDNYLSAISLFRADPMLRKHLNSADRGFSIQEGELNQIAGSFASAENRARVRKGLVWFENNGQATAALAHQDDDGYRYLVQLIEQSPSRQMVRRARPLEFIGNMLGFFSTVTFDSLFNLEKEGVQVSSMLFGNAVGLVETRRGKLDHRSQVLENFSSNARAGDILLEKTPFRLTDAFIPGHWGHVAVWIGNEAELRALGIWDRPLVQRHKDAIQAGKGVVEALRSGVVMNTFDHFSNVDDFAVLRQPGLSSAQRAEVILQALRQVGKGYDFNFDVQSTDRIVCSELVYHSYVHLDWPTERRLGRVTISPDNVAVRATGEGPLSVVMLYHDGEEITANKQQAMAGLVQNQVVRLARR